MFDLLTDSKSISVDKLKSMLVCIPNNYQQQPNDVGNIKILDANHQYLGYINLASESIEIIKNHD